MVTHRAIKSINETTAGVNNTLCGKFGDYDYITFTKGWVTCKECKKLMKKKEVLLNTIKTGAF